MSTSSVPRIDLYQDVTNRIIQALEAGTTPWICPWVGGDPAATNLSTGKPYRGINILLLNLQAITSGFQHNQWLTFLQAKALGGNVRRGEQGSGIVFFKMHEVDGESSKHEPPEDRRVIPLLRSYTVFNVQQIEGLPAHLLPVPAVSIAI
jgi:antirestriction protein ArdC